MRCTMVALLLVAFVGLAQGRAWEAVADGIPELEEVEKALHMVASAKLDPKQQAAAQRAVADVEKVMADMSSNHSLTKAQKATKVKGAIRELQGLQAQWQLAAVESSLKKVVADPHLTPQQLSKAKSVVSEVEAALDEVEAGKLDDASRGKKVASAIKQLEGLEQELAKGIVSPKEADLEQKIAAKKMQLKQAQTELKLADLNEELLKKKMQLQKLVAAQTESEEEAKQRQEGAAEQEQVSKLLAAAKSLASARKAELKPLANATVVLEAQVANATTALHSVAGKAPIASRPDINAIVSELQAKAQKDSASLAKFDSDFAQRMDKLQKAIIDSKKTSSMQGKKAGRGAGMMQNMLKNQQRLHAKDRALRVSEVNDLNSGIKSIQQGDMAALTNLLGKMQKESKSLQAAAANFLH